MKSDLYTKAFILMGLANFFTVSSFGCFFLFPLFISAHGGSKSDIGIIMGAFAFSSVVCRPWVSEIIDRIGRKNSYAAGSMSMTLVSISYLFCKGPLSGFYPFLILLRLIHGIGLAICFTATFTYIADIVPKQRLNEGLGMFGMTGLIGLAVGPVIGELAIKRFGFPCFFVTATVLAFTGLLFQVFIHESYRPGQKWLDQDGLQTIQKIKTSPDLTDDVNEYFPDNPKGSVSFFAILRKEEMIPIAILSISFGFVMAATGNFVAPFAKSQGIGFISLYYITYSFSAVITRFFGGRLADGIGERIIIPYASIITGIGVGMLIFARGNIMLVISGMLSGCGHGFLFPCMNSLAIRDQPVHIRGKVTGIFTGAIDAGAFIGSIALGYIGEFAGYRAIFFVSMIFMFMGLGFFKIRSSDKRPISPEQD